MRPQRTIETTEISSAEAKAQMAMFAAACPERFAAMTAEEIHRRWRVSRKYAEAVKGRGL